MLRPAWWAKDSRSIATFSRWEASERPGGEAERRYGGRTYLSPHHLSQGTYKLGCSIRIEAEGFFIHDLADGEPQRGFEALRGLSSGTLDGME